MMKKINLVEKKEKGHDMLLDIKSHVNMSHHQFNDIVDVKKFLQSPTQHMSNKASQLDKSHFAKWNNDVIKINYWLI